MAFSNNSLERGMEVDGAQEKSIKEFPLPAFEKVKRGSPGQLGLYRCFVKNLATVSISLTKLFQKGVSFKTNSEFTLALNCLRQGPNDNLGLRTPIFSEPCYNSELNREELVLGSYDYDCATLHSDKRSAKPGIICSISPLQESELQEKGEKYEGEQGLEIMESKPTTNESVMQICFLPDVIRSEGLLMHLMNNTLTNFTRRWVSTAKKKRNETHEQGLDPPALLGR